LGGALTNIFAFYASLEDRFTRNGAVQAVTFGCPRMAAYQFADAVKYQGDIGKLQIARFHNQKDAIAHLPPYLVRCSKRGAKYYHLGLDVHLPLIRKNIFTILGQPQPKVRFWDSEGWFQSYKRQWCEFYGFNVPIRPWMLANHHSLIEHQKRMQLVNSESPLMKATLAEIYDMKEEYTANKIKRRNKGDVSSDTFTQEN
jgi:Lipase (class 3)